MCPDPSLGHVWPVWPIDVGTGPSSARRSLLARPTAHPCRNAGTAITVHLLAVGPVIFDEYEAIECAASGGCPWRSSGPDPRGARVAVPVQRGCWLDATTVQSIVVALSRAGHPLPYTITGFTSGHLAPPQCRALAGWLYRHTNDYLHDHTPEARGRCRAVIGYATRWLTWAADLGGLHVLNAGEASPPPVADGLTRSAAKPNGDPQVTAHGQSIAEATVAVTEGLDEHQPTPPADTSSTTTDKQAL